jgi:hypothetical protein
MRPVLPYYWEMAIRYHIPPRDVFKMTPLQLRLYMKG